MVTLSAAGIILAGGRASRFDPTGQVDKGLLRLAGQPLVAHTAQLLHTYTQQILISANRYLNEYCVYGAVHADEPDLGVYQGPMAGLATCMAHLSHQWAYVAPVDLPLMSGAVYARLSSAAQHGSSGVAYVQAARMHPLCMVIHKDLAPTVRQYVLEGERKVMLFLQQVQAQAVDCVDLDEGVFLNVNTGADLAQAERILALRQRQPI